jgi:hypothetical protein
LNLIRSALHLIVVPVEEVVDVVPRLPDAPADIVQVIVVLFKGLLLGLLLRILLFLGFLLVLTLRYLCYRSMQSKDSYSIIQMNC